MFIYLVVAETAKMIVGTPDTVQKRLTIHIGGIVGGLFAAFGYTYWFSAVETSVYNLSMLVIAICTWLMLRWAQSTKPDRDKLLILVAFLGFLGIGLHMYSMVIFPPAFLFMMMWDEKKRKDWRLWIMGVLLASVVYSLAIFIWISPVVLAITAIMIFAPTKELKYAMLAALFIVVFILLQQYGLPFFPDFFNNNGELTGTIKFLYVIAAIAATAALPLTSQDRKSEWKFCFFLALFAVVGYSVHLAIPIRSALEPMINENHPSNIEALVGFLERRQYGSESMVSRMFWRRGYLSNQFGIEEHMGYGGFHLTQFFRFDLADNETPKAFFAVGPAAGAAKLLLYLIPTAMMIFGWIYLYRKNRAASIFLASLALVTTIGMVLYMNFADGNRPEKYDYIQWMNLKNELMGKGVTGDRLTQLIGPMPTVHREVRVRDYFFTAGFMFFGMWVGIAASCILNALHSSKDEGIRTTLASICAVLLILSPVLPAATNHKLNNRSGDWVSFDYAYNLLNSCEENGILFTNGDNDTFPLWALQEAYGIRKDVRIVNLSLVNTDWYIKQLKQLEPKVDISYSDVDVAEVTLPSGKTVKKKVLSEIEKLRPKINEFTDTSFYKMKNGLTVKLPSAREQRLLRVQDMMVINIVETTNWSKPIYFATSVSNDNLMGLAPYLEVQGFVYKLMPKPVPPANRYNLDRTIELVDSVYQFRGLGKAKYNNTSRRQLSYYLQIALELRAPMDRLRNELNWMIAAEEKNSQPADTIPAADSAAAPAQNERLAQAQALYDTKAAAVLRFYDTCVNMMPWELLAHQIRHEFYMEHNMLDEAIAAMEKALADNPENDTAQFQEMLDQAKREKERA
jgi:hypothetical protein